MTDYDVFNGDADGICALVQLRNAEPRDATHITGVKRDIALLGQVEAGDGDRVTVLDVSLDKNREALLGLLARGAGVFYCDHHFAGEIPDASGLTTSINTAPDVCTSSLINAHLRGRFVEWALVGTFGDNLRTSALKLALPLGLDAAELDMLERLGIYVNYNAYGASIEDLHFPPTELFARLSAHRTPQGFINDDRETFDRLEQGYNDDMSKAREAKILSSSAHAAVLMLPDQAWARRVSGVFGNQLANEHPDRAHAVITERASCGFLVSVRAPLTNKVGADEICRQFPTGGGRKAAAGINDLPVASLDEFIAVFSGYYS